ncbi:ATP-binding cassette domain-containing protein, partial [bacterium]|nr:ATP-binding cassette domain-containing protein [bacterium]
MSPALVEIENLRTYFRGRHQLFGERKPDIRAVDGVSFSIAAGESYALVGESGCGKSTTGRSILRLVQPTSGTIRFGGRDVIAAAPAELRGMRREMQMIFQDPYSSLNPRMRAQDIVAEPLIVHGLASGAEATAQARKILDRCGIPEGSARRFPSEFSGGQRQRIVIARALVTKPRFIVADEPVSALDVSIQAQILNLLQDLQAEYSLTYLFISHDLAVVRTVTDRIAVMYLGKLVEEADTERFFAGPLHPYSQALLSSVPRDHPRRETNRIILSGTLPSAANPPDGCRFHTRCPVAGANCQSGEPGLIAVAPGPRVACHRARLMGEGERLLP